MITFLPILLLVAIIIFIYNESFLLIIPSVLLIFLFTILFALMIIGNVVWSEAEIFLVILLYLTFLFIEIFSIVYSVKNFKSKL